VTATTAQRFRSAPILVPLVLAAVALIVYLPTPMGLIGGEPGRIADQWVYHLTFLFSAVACFGRAWVDRRERGAWICLGAGLLAWALGDVYWTAAFYQEAGKIPYPSFADLGYLAAYPFMYVGLLLLIRSRVDLGASRWLDGAIGGFAAATVGAAVLAPALLGLTKGDPAAVATNLAYPLGDLLLIGFVVSGAVLAGRRAGATWVTLGSGLLIWAIADGIYLYQEATSSYVGGMIDVLWPLGGLTIAAAAACRSPAHEQRAPTHSVFVPTVCSLAAAGILVWDHSHRLHTLSIGLASVTIALVVLRLALSFRENNRLLRAMHDETVTDALTGLRNRRALLADLGRLAQSADGRRALFAIFDLDGFKAYNDSFGHPAGDLLLRRMGTSLAGAVGKDGTAYRLGGDEFCLLIRGDRPTFMERMSAASEALHESGEGFDIGSSSGTAIVPDEATNASDALRIADRRMYAEKGRRSSSAERQTRDVLVRILREREPQLGQHLDGVADLAVRVGRELGLAGEDLDVLGRAAELHDIGKIAIPERILQKADPLDEEDWALVRTHTLIGERILGVAPAMAPVASLVRSSHERWDGEGYPDGLGGEEIPLGARIIFVCDAFDAITVGRPYATPRSTEDAIEELRANAGTQFDPEMVAVLCRVQAAAAHPARSL
jgi:two-component system cell cycle response regulator